MGSIINGIAGFVFWVLAARLYSHEQVGIASALMAIIALLGTIALPGFDIAIARFINDEQEKGKMVNSCASVAAILAFILGVGSLLILKTTGSAWYSAIDSVYFLVLFVVLVILDPIVVLQRQGIFIGMRKSQYSFYQSLTSLIGLIPVVLLARFEVSGIVTSAGIATLAALGAGFALMLKMRIRPAFEIRRQQIARLLKFSIGNYVAKVLIYLPGQLLPILVINLMDASSNAYFYIAWAINGLLVAIPTAVSFSLLAEGSNNPDELGHLLKRSLQITSVVLLIATAVIMLTARYILMLFGSGYSDVSFYPLLLLAAGNIPAAFNVLLVAAFRVKQQIKAVILVHGGIAVLTILGSYFLIPLLDLEGIGLAWVGANLIVAVISAVTVSRRRF
jgi:O-antigen/teichoic acid export membrane protein